jgi:hypothetical protein
VVNGKQKMRIDRDFWIPKLMAGFLVLTLSNFVFVVVYGMLFSNQVLPVPDKSMSPLLPFLGVLLGIAMLIAAGVLDYTRPRGESKT